MTISWDLILGGFAMFIYGIKIMGDGLKAVAGDSLRHYIDKYTSKPIMGLLIGSIITVMIQSSSATTAITIGLVRSGLMKLEQAAGIVMGANIGTTVTAFLIGLSVEEYALYFVLFGSLIISFTSRKKLNYIGQIILGFGLLFFGLKIMGDSLKALKDLPAFASFAQTMGAKPLLAALAGTIMTGAIQSSSVVVGVVQKIYESGSISLVAAIAFVFGSNIGTTITGVIASLGGSLAARRTAGIHTLFNVVGTLVWLIFIYPLASFILVLTQQFHLEPMMQIAVVHIIFNVSSTLIFFPLLKQMCDLIRKVIPGNEVEKIDIKVDELDPNLPHTLPSAALGVCESAVLKLASVVKRNVKEVYRYFEEGKINSENHDLIRQNESLINHLDKTITNYIMLINKQELTDHDVNISNLHLQVIKNLERVGDLAVNLMEFFEMVYEDKKGNFSKQAQNEINELFLQLLKMIDMAIQVYKTNDLELLSELHREETIMDNLEHTSRLRHFKRMSEEICSSTIAGAVYCDILANIERMGDHCLNIGKRKAEVNVINENSWN